MVEAISGQRVPTNPTRDAVPSVDKLLDKVAAHASKASVNFDRQTADLDNPITDQMRPQGSSSAPGFKFSAAQHMGELDLDTGIDSIGGPLELVDKTVDQMSSLGRNAVLAQANQLPPVALSLGQ